MEKKMKTNLLVDYIKFGDEESIHDIQELITALIDFKREKRKEGWKNMRITKTLYDKNYPGVLFVYGDRLETDAEFECRKKDADEYRETSTEDLLVKLDEARKFGLCDAIGNIKDELSLREHVPSKAERRVIRQLKARTGISSTDELREKHGLEIAEELKKYH